MIFIDKMKNLKIYKKPMFLPTLPDDKKKKSTILLLTPNYESSKRLMDTPLTINRLRYQSYYMERDLTYFISSKVLNSATMESYVHENSYDELYHNLTESSSEEKERLRSTDYGLPSKKKYPMKDADHVRSAIRFFNYVDEEDEEELATNIIRKIKKFKMRNVGVGKNNRFYPYYASAFNINDTVKESSTIYGTTTESVSGVITDAENKILLLDHVKCDGITLPGGKVNEGETIEDALKRELFEELGIEVTEFTFSNVKTFECEYPAGSGQYRVFTDTTFEITGYTGEIINKEPDKHRSILYYTRDELIAHDGIEYKYSTLLENYLNIWSSKVNDISDISVYALSTFLNYSGYESDVNLLKSIINPESYYTILKDVLHLPVKGISQIPRLSWNIYGGDGDSTVAETKADRDHITVFIDIPKKRDDEAIEDFITRVIYTATAATLYGRFPKTTDTMLPEFITSYLMDIEDSEYANNGRTMVEKHTLENIYSNFESGDIQEYIINKEAKAAPITVDNLKRKFQYASTSKIKRATSLRSTNKTSNLIDSIKDKMEEQKKSMGVIAPSSDDSENTFEESYLNGLHEGDDYVRTGDTLFFFNEDAKYDPMLKKILYNDRIKQRKDILAIDKRVKEEVEFIKYAYPDLDKYMGKNLFVDLYYYNEVFFKNNTWKLKRGFDLYLDLLDRLINDPRLSRSGYTKTTIFIPVLDWNTNRTTKMWMYKEDINPISIIFELMRVGSPKLKEVFKNKDIVFFGNDKYFKMNYAMSEDIKKDAIKFRTFIMKLIAGQEFDLEDVDTSLDNAESTEVIRANIVDKIEQSKGVDLTPKMAAVAAKSKELQAEEAKKAKGNVVAWKDPLRNPSTKEKTLAADETNKALKDAKVTKTIDVDKKRKEEANLEKIAASIDSISQAVISTDDAMDAMDQDRQLKSLLVDIDSMKSDSVKVDAARASRINDLNKEFLNKTIKDRSIQDILDDKPNEKQLETTTLKVASPNEEWKEMKYMNFDKDYDLDRDIVMCIGHFGTVSCPINVRNIDVKDNSTSEDRLDLYTIDMEDFRGKRFTVKLDIPKAKDNRFLLRGNTKAIQTQLFNMPIIKTNLDTCQIISNYQKIFIYRINDTAGRSLSYASRLVKAAQKYEGKKIKFSYGDNTKICSKYELPMDYVDLAGIFNKIETDRFTIYFNQDEIRADYPNIDDSYGLPFVIDKKNVSDINYMTIGEATFSSTVLSYLTGIDPKFDEIFNSVKPNSGAYSRCNILNSKIPMVVILGYWEGLSSVLKKAGIWFELKEKLTPEDKLYKDYIRFSDGYLVYESSYQASLLLNGLKDCSTEIYSMMDIDNKNIYFEMLDDFGGRIKADGLDNFKDCLVDPMTRESLEHYKLPTDIISIFLYANMLLSDNKFVKHTDASSRRIRRSEMIAAYTYEALSEAYGAYANEVRHNRSAAQFTIRQDAVINKFLMSPISSDDSIINALNAVETTNAITFKGKAGLNDERSYSLDKRTYDDTMINVLGMSTGFSGNVGITRQTTMDMNIESERGYIKTIDSDTDKMNSIKTLTATEALTPFGSTRDDAPRTAMTFIQTAKHAVRTVESDPLLVTSGADEALAYITTDKFAFKAKQNGVVKELTDDYMIIDYGDNKKEYINLKETVEKNSDGGFYVPLKLDVSDNLKVGSKFTKDQILAYDRLSFSNTVGESDNIAYNIGKLAKVAIINTDEGFEDSGMCTESISRKLATKIIMKMDHTLDKNANVFKIVKVGDEVDVEDALIIWQDPFEEEEANALIKSLAGDSDYVTELGRKAIRSDIAGKVVDIKIYRTVETNELSDSLKKIVNAYEKSIKELKKKLDEEGIESKDLPATYKLNPTGKLKKAQDAVFIEFFVEYDDPVSAGDKITYYSANKAVIKTKVPDALAPYTDFRPNEPVEAFVSESSIDKRMVTSTMIIGSIQKLMVELDRSVKDMAGIKYDDSKV